MAVSLSSFLVMTEWGIVVLRCFEASIQGFSSCVGSLFAWGLICYIGGGRGLCGVYYRVDEDAGA